MWGSRIDSAIELELRADLFDPMLAVCGTIAQQPSLRVLLLLPVSISNRIHKLTPDCKRSDDGKVQIALHCYRLMSPGYDLMSLNVRSLMMNHQTRGDLVPPTTREYIDALANTVRPIILKTRAVMKPTPVTATTTAAAEQPDESSVADRVVQVRACCACILSRGIVVRSHDWCYSSPTS